MDKDASKQYLKMTQTPIPRLVVTLGIPTTVSMLVTNIYNMADTYFVSKLGTSASGAVGVVFGLMAIIQAIGFMFGHGAGSIISRKLGEKDRESASRFASTSFFYSLAVGILFAIFGLIFVEPLMRLLGSTDTVSYTHLANASIQQRINARSTTLLIFSATNPTINEANNPNKVGNEIS